jgi:AraC family transcriptional regulator
MLRSVQPLLAFAAAHLDEDVSLASLAARAGLSAFHLHRVFSATAGETPKQYTLRLRLGRAAAMLLTGNDSVLNVALACGFQSHEAFSRAFRRRFGMTPRDYRARGFTPGPEQTEEHARLVNRVGPCVGLFRMSENGRSQRSDMAYSIEKKELSPQPVLVVRRRVKPTEIAATLAEVLQQVFLYAQRTGTALAGQPFTRYLDWGPGLLTIEAGMPVAAVRRDISGEAGILGDELPGGPVAATTHAGPYDKLPEAHAAVQVWIEAQGLATAGAPWECYVTDPADYPDPKDWKTEVFWPLAR